MGRTTKHYQFTLFFNFDERGRQQAEKWREDALAYLKRLFERFYRVDKARSRELGGTGLGLAIVKHIAQAHGGVVEVESAPDEGSTFSIHIPLAA